MFMVPVLQENGEEAYDMYSMKQPFCVDLEYTVTIVTNKYEVLNDMNQRVHFEFKAINCYINPNGHYMPMVLEDVSDESEYSLDDRKYYSQSYKIKVKAYIIRKEDFTVTKVPSRAIMRLLGVTDKKKPKIQVGEEDYIADECCLRETTDPYYNKLLTVNKTSSVSSKLPKWICKEQSLSNMVCLSNSSTCCFNRFNPLFPFKTTVENSTPDIEPSLKGINPNSYKRC